MGAGFRRPVPSVRPDRLLRWCSASADGLPHRTTGDASAQESRQTENWSDAMSIRLSSAGMTRRAVLEAGLAAGAFGLSGASLLSSGARAAPASGSEILTGSHWGAFRAKVENGRFVGIRPWEKDPHPDPVLEGVLDSVYSPTRIKHPMVRRAFLEHGPGSDPDARGDGDFVRVTWDQALDLVAKELKRVDQTYGPTATFAGSYGWMSPGKLHNCQALLRRMLNLKGGFVNSSGDYSTGEPEGM